MNQLRERGDICTGELLGGRYRLAERIGEGGMARVFRAEDTALGRTVAVKVLRGPVDGLATVERARSETMVLASLNHHGLVTLFDARVSEDDDSYLVMEFVDGITLQERLHRGSMGSSEAAQLAVDIAEGLHAAHSAGIVHRDIKPSNVLLAKSPLPGREWRAKIADFGIACLRDSSRLTAPGIMVGTVAYIAPEQARGAAPAPAADIYALGLVLIEALSGTRPFADAEGIGAVMARLQDSPPIPDHLDERWQQLLRGMTTMDPADRPTALEVAVTAGRIASQSTVDAAVDEPTAFTPDAATSGTTMVLPLAGSAGAGLAGAGLVAASSARAGSVGAGSVRAGTARAGSVGAGTARAGSVETAAARAGSADTAALVAGDASVGAPSAPARRDRTRRTRRRRGFLGGGLLAVLLAASIFGAVTWAGSPQNVPEPVPSQPVDETVVEPRVVPTPAEEDPVVVVDDGNSGSGNGNNSSGNGNSGPGNNNGNGNGNGGSGNGNSGAGNNKGKGND